MIYNPRLSYDPREIALEKENIRLAEENYRLVTELEYYKSKSISSVPTYLEVQSPVTEPVSGINTALHRIVVAESRFEPDKFNYHMIGRWEGGPTADDHFGYSYYVSKMAFYDAADKAQLVQMLMEKTANALARRILGEK